MIYILLQSDAKKFVKYLHRNSFEIREHLEETDTWELVENYTTEMLFWRVQTWHLRWELYVQYRRNRPRLLRTEETRCSSERLLNATTIPVRTNTPLYLIGRCWCHLQSDWSIPWPSKYTGLLNGNWRQFIGGVISGFRIWRHAFNTFWICEIERNMQVTRMTDLAIRYFRILPPWKEIIDDLKNKRPLSNIKGPFNY